jgi:pectin methylesterase-like acyl-CoA thioesterase
MKLGLRLMTPLCALLAPACLLAKYDAVVSADGSGTHATVQAAVNSAPANAARPFVILVKPGVYREHVAVDAGRPNIRLVGEPGAAARTVITGGTNVNTPGPDGKKLSTRDSSVVLVQAVDFRAENITFENTTTLEERVQALALYVEADRAVFRNCRFLGWQDTLIPISCTERLRLRLRLGRAGPTLGEQASRLFNNGANTGETPVLPVAAALAEDTPAWSRTPAPADYHAQSLRPHSFHGLVGRTLAQSAPGGRAPP